MDAGFVIVPATMTSISGLLRGPHSDHPFEMIGVHSYAAVPPESLPQACIGFDGCAMGRAAVKAVNRLLDGIDSPGMLKTIAPVLIPAG